MASRGCCRWPCGPRRLDRHQEAKIKETSLRRYRKSVQAFTLWLAECEIWPSGPDQWDDALVEWKNARPVAKAEFEACVAGVEFLFPRFRGKLSWAHAVISGWSVVHTPHHTVPLEYRPCRYLAATLCSEGHSKLAFGMLLQRELGLRPSEMLQILPEDISLPEENGSSRAAEPRATIALGMRSGTKAKRPQAVTLRDPLLIGLLRWAKRTCTAGQFIVPYTNESYRRILMRTTTRLGLNHIGWTPHSPRSGFASELIASGADFVAVREAGRWLADSSLRTYIDLARVAFIATELQLSGLREALDWTDVRIVSFFAAARPQLWQYASSRVEAEQVRRPLLTAVTDADPECVSEAEEPSGFSGHAATPPRHRRGRGRGRR